MIDGMKLAEILMVAAHMEQEGGEMKSSDIEKAKDLRKKAQLYTKFSDWLTGYPPYDAYLVVNGEEISISRTAAHALIDDLDEVNTKAMEAIGLEFDE